MQQCGRCGWLTAGDPRFCSVCNDGVADEERVRELVGGVADGSVGALGLLAEICDPAALDPLVRLAESSNPYLRAAAVSSLGYIGDQRALPVVLACAEDSEEMVVRSVIGALAELGGDDAKPALAELADRPGLGEDARRALAFLGIHRDFDEIVEKLADPKVWGWALARAEWTKALGAVGDLRALDHLTELMDRVRAEEPWEGVDIVRAVAEIGLPECDPVLRSWADIDGVVGAIARQALDEDLVDEDDDLGLDADADAAARTVRRWVMRPTPVDRAATDLVTKFGGQPVWRDGPMWPLSAATGFPMTFYAQFRLPREIVGDGTWMAYLFLTPEGETFSWDGGENALVVQPGPDQLAVDTVAVATGPSSMTEIWDDNTRFRRRRRMPRQEYAVDLTAGFDPESWSDEVIEDRHGDWNKLGGTPRWLHGSGLPDTGYRFAFQFTASAFGTEFGDGAEAYGFVRPDGRGAFLWQCH